MNLIVCFYLTTLMCLWYTDVHDRDSIMLDTCMILYGILSRDGNGYIREPLSDLCEVMGVFWTSTVKDHRYRCVHVKHFFFRTCAP